MDITAIVSVMCVFVFAPAIVFGFILMTKRSRLKVEELRYKRDMMALEIEKEKTRLQLIEAENAKYDRIIESSDRR